MKRTPPILLSLVLLISMLSACSAGTRFDSFSDEQKNEAYAYLLEGLNQAVPYYADYQAQLNGTSLTQPVQIQNADFVLDAYAEVTIPFALDQASLAQLRMIYQIGSDTLLSPILSVAINGETPFVEALSIDVALNWLSDTSKFPLDSYQDESLPAQVVDSRPRVLDFYDNLHSSATPLQFSFTAGDNTITLTNVSSTPMTIKELWLVPLDTTPTYSNYSAGLSKADKGTLLIDAIRYSSKNSSFVRLSSYGSPSVSPYSVKTKLLNIIDGVAWNKPGQSVSYTITVEKAGAYALSVHYLNDKTDFQVFRSVLIDGVIPFKEVAAYAFDYSGAGNWNVEILQGSDKQPYLFNLSAGTHTVTFMAESQPINPSLTIMRNLIAHINAFALDIRKITGRDVDRSRTWKLTTFLPETQKNLDSYKVLITRLITDLSAYAPNGTGSSALSYLAKALVKVDKMLEKPDELPLYLDDLYSATGSVTEMLGNTLSSLNSQPLSFDSFAFYTDKQPITKKASIVDEASSAVLSFVNSFTSKKYIAKKDPKVLNVWVNRSILYVDTMQKLVDQTFTPNTGIKVKISVMPDVNKLILANATNQAPDVALGLPSYMPYDFAIRGAAYQLSSFPDFWKVVGNMPAGSMVPYVLNEQVYAIPETLDFHALIYRKDIFAKVNLEVPNTWQDVIDMLPELQRYGMNFYHLTAGGTALKWYYQTSPFIYQFGGELYAPDGYSSAIDSPEAVAGLKFMTDLFIKYAIPEQVASFYNGFRFGSLPVGITDFSTYLQIKNAASELTGLWALAPYPGTENAEGDILRWDIVNGTSGIIFKSTEYPTQSWDFMKWWTSTETQTSFAYGLQSTYGPEYVWLSSNLEAVKNAPIDAADKRVILEQFKWINDVPRLPGGYMLERSLSDIWNSTVLTGTPIRVAIDMQKITVDREIKRKMIEFGYLNADGSIAKPYVIRGVDWIQAQIDTAKGN
jgi:ABC-type glycerol-3-phosphate transport system substrate-binding protein